MKRLSETTIRQRGRLLYGAWGSICVAFVIFGLVLQHWGITLLALVAGGCYLALWLMNEKRTRDDPPHADY